ncbi:response regulator [Brevundimonas sp.]|uniref:response regulator n=1 Tax=Brevundimonas sp. TaxID=1871086 RepID=UPI001DF9E661|nr:response regulator [Brevundimonas sp.]MBL0947347.1 response regulator [Brevundimonas sp.]
MSNPGLEGRKVLVVEDESLVAMLLETMLEDMGCTIFGTAARVEDALELVAGDTAPDVALLDVNVAGQTVYPVAEALDRKGVPLVFSTGYGQGGLAEDWAGRPTVQKPYTEAMIRDALMRVLDVRYA